MAEPLGHMGLSPEEQEKDVARDIMSVNQLMTAIESRREKRMETTPRAIPAIPPAIQILAGYKDGGVDSWDLVMTIEQGAIRDRKGILKPMRGDARKFLKAQTDKELASASDAQKAKSIFSRVKVEMLYPAIEREAIEMMKQYKMYYALFRKCQVQYSGANTASIGWDSNSKRFILRINKQFIVYMTIMNLVNGYPKSTMSNLKALLSKPIPGQGPPSGLNEKILGSTLLYVLLHEMGHIFFQHTGKRGGLYSQFDHYEVNKYGDILINLTLTKMIGGDRVDQDLVPNVGLGKDVTQEAYSENAQESVRKFIQMTSPVVVYSPEVMNLWDKYRPEPASLVVIYSPGAFVEIGSSTATLLKFYKLAEQALIPPKKVTVLDKKEKGEKPVPPKKISTPVVPGQVVMIEATGEIGVVVKVGDPMPGEIEGDFHQGIEVVRKADLPDDLQKMIDAAVVKAGEPEDASATMPPELQNVAAALAGRAMAEIPTMPPEMIRALGGKPS